MVRSAKCDLFKQKGAIESQRVIWVEAAGGFLILSVHRDLNANNEVSIQYFLNSVGWLFFLCFRLLLPPPPTDGRMTSVQEPLGPESPRPRGRRRPLSRFVCGWRWFQKGTQKKYR